MSDMIVGGKSQPPRPPMNKFITDAKGKVNEAGKRVIDEIRLTFSSVKDPGHGFLTRASLQGKKLMKGATGENAKKVLTMVLNKLNALSRNK